MSIIKNEHKEQLHVILGEIKRNPLDKQQVFSQLLSQVDLLSRTEEGMRYLFTHIVSIVQSGIFAGTAWEHPDRLVPSLVRGTLLSGLPTNVMEILSELRILKAAQGKVPEMALSANEAQGFLEEALVSSFDLALGELTEQLRMDLSPTDQKRLRILFEMILEHIPLEQLKEKLAYEVETIAYQRPIISHRLENILELVHKGMDLSKNSRKNRSLELYVGAIYGPSPLSRDHPDPRSYISHIKKASGRTLRNECKALRDKLKATGLVSSYHIKLLRYVAGEETELIPVLLGLNDHGKAEFAKHQSFVVRLIKEFIPKANKQAIFGLRKMLQRNLLSRKPVWHALNKLTSIQLDPKVEKRLNQQMIYKDTDAHSLLVSGTIGVLGQPLGVGQGNNPTCQSARGISMWSQHAPAKLLNMIIDAATSNKLTFRYEGELIDSVNLLPQKEAFDLDLDPVSVVLVPLLDTIYGKMMQKAMAKHLGQDPHVSVNPAFYGHWIQTGFISCYNMHVNAIQNYERFVKTFYASFHPNYNGGHGLVYPVPLGIFITDSHARMLGFHAVSLLNVRKDNNGELRAYFYNPNNEGRQNWGQQIKPTVASHGELPGESSLPFHEFVSRVYAFHFNTNGIEERILEVDAKVVKKVERLALESWGRKYIWI